MVRKTPTTSRLASSSAAVLLLGLVTACGGDTPPADPGLEGLGLARVAPDTVVPGSAVLIEGRSFVEETWGTSRLVLEGTFDDGSGSSSIDVSLPATFVDFGEMTITVDESFFAAFPAPSGDFSGNAVVEIDSTVDGKTYRSDTLQIDLAIRQELTPTLSEVASGDLIYVNDRIEVVGDGILLGGDEGTTYAVLDGCFRPSGAGECSPIDMTEVPVVSDDLDRSSGGFAFAPSVAGIDPGSFEGTVALRNEHAAGSILDSGEVLDVDYEVIESAVLAVSPSAASLGQYVEFEGGGFVTEADGGYTIARLEGTFSPASGEPETVDPPVELLLEVVDGRRGRYVLNEDDEGLGERLDLRRVTGTFTGTVTPVVGWGGETRTGTSESFTLEIAPVKQVVYVKFMPAYVESLRKFGLRAVDARIRQRVIEVVQRDYRGINLEVRTEEPTDFALFATAEVHGPDPYPDFDLLGLDNTAGKDTGNLRLHDTIGGFNALTQQDGYPGFGGVFIENLFAFSEHPNGLSSSVPLATSDFDDIFDPFRPDQGGTPVTSQDGINDIPMLTSGDGCPASARSDRIACAIWVLGSLIGTTLSHEIGHSLGLANPFGEGFHNSSDEINRLMDSGGDRPFAERAELFGEGPGSFCTGAYDYLRQILPTDEPDDADGRPSCF